MARKLSKSEEAPAKPAGVIVPAGEGTSFISPEPSDRLLFKKWTGAEVKVGDQDLLIMGEADLLGIAETTSEASSANSAVSPTDTSKQEQRPSPQLRSVALPPPEQTLNPAGLAFEVAHRPLPSRNESNEERHKRQIRETCEYLARHIYTLQSVIEFVESGYTEFTEVFSAKIINVAKYYIDSAKRIDPESSNSLSLHEMLDERESEIPSFIILDALRHHGVKYAANIDRTIPSSASSLPVRRLTVFEKGLVEEFELSAAEAVELAPAAREAIIRLKAPPNPAPSTDAQVSDPRFAHIEKYVDRPKGEDAIGFYQRAWSAAPQPYYREDVAEHDPALVAAMSERCNNLNRKLPKGAERHSLENYLPQRRPIDEKTAARREANRRHQAAHIARLKGFDPTA